MWMIIIVHDCTYTVYYNHISKSTHRTKALISISLYLIVTARTESTGSVGRQSTGLGVTARVVTEFWGSTVTLLVLLRVHHTVAAVAVAGLGNVLEARVVVVIYLVAHLLHATRTPSNVRPETRTVARRRHQNVSRFIVLYSLTLMSDYTSIIPKLP